MAKVKIPLVMKNGEKAKDMESLRENFDVEAVIGYFLDGKLFKWLNDRYYEEEAEAVAQLDRDDPQLARKLCNIFRVEYTGYDEIDTEEIIRQKERLAYLRQLTDDEEILRNIDCVAFDQEELAELYDRGAEKIYLCEGSFKIPKSKSGLEYIVTCGAKVDGLPEKVPPLPPEPAYDTWDGTIPLELADQIHLLPYVILEDYIVWFDRHKLPRPMIPGFSRHEESEEQAPTGAFSRWNKHTGEITCFDIPSLDGEKLNAFFAGNENRLLLIFWGGRSSQTYEMTEYDVESGMYRSLCEDVCQWNGGERISYADGRVAYWQATDKLRILDVNTGKEVLTKCFSGNPSRKCFFTGDKFFYYYGGMSCFDLATGTDIKLKGADLLLMQPPVLFENSLYFLLHNVYEDELRLVSTDPKNPDTPVKVHFRKKVGLSYGTDHLVSRAPYIIYYSNSPEAMYVYNLRTKQENKIFSGKVSHLAEVQIVGDYLYYRLSQSDSILRYELSAPNCAPIGIGHEDEYIGKMTTV